MDGIQGAILSVKLRHLASWNERRRAIAARYDSALRPRGFKTISPSNRSTPVYHLYVVESSNRDEVRNALSAAGIETGVHYPVPLHQQPSFAHDCHGVSLAATERVAGRILSLPICGDLTDQEQDLIVEEYLRVARP